MADLRSQLQFTVQHNCDIFDARFARDYSMCIYQMRMQKHFRWKNAIPLDGAFNSEALGNWIRETKDNRDINEATDFHPITIGNNTYNTIDTDNINHALVDTELASSADSPWPTLH